MNGTLSFYEYRFIGGDTIVPDSEIQSYEPTKW